MSDPQPDRTLDTSGLCCPEPMLQTNRTVKTMQPGEVLEVISTDVGSWMDIPAWCGRTRHELLHKAQEDGVFRYYIRKRA